MLGDLFMAPEDLTASRAGGIVVADLHRYPLPRTNMPLERMNTTSRTLFSHGSLPVRFGS